MPVINKINRIFSFPTLYELNNLQKRNILYNSHIAFEETDDGGISPLNIPIAPGKSIITMNKYGDYVYHNGNDDYIIYLNNGDNTYTTLQPYTDQQITNAINDGKYYKTVWYGGNAQRIPVIIFKDIIIYTDLIEASDSSIRKLIAVVTDKQNNITQVYTLQDNLGTDDYHTATSAVVSEINNTFCLYVYESTYGDSGTSGTWFNPYKYMWYFTVNNNQIYHNSSAYVSASRFYYGFSYPVLYNNQLITLVSDEYTYGGGGVHSSGDYTFSYIFNDNGSITYIINHGNPKFCYAEDEEHTSLCPITDIQPITSNIPEIMAYQVINDRENMWIYYGVNSYGLVHQYADSIRFTNALPSNVSYFNYKNKYLYYADGYILYKLNITNNTATAIYNFRVYGSSSGINGVLKRAYE